LDATSDKKKGAMRTCIAEIVFIHIWKKVEWSDADPTKRTSAMEKETIWTAATRREVNTASLAVCLGCRMAASGSSSTMFGI
jgi:hypothetical protein